MRADARENYDRLLAVARAAVIEDGADASLRDIARKAGVGLGTLYRHFPSREALLEALLHNSFKDLAAKADDLIASSVSDAALVSWLRAAVAMTHSHRGVIAPMMAAIDDPTSALHASCVTLKTAGARLLQRAQADGKARSDVNGADLFALIAALAWLHDQPSSASRANHLVKVIGDALIVKGAGSRGKAAPRG